MAAWKLTETTVNLILAHIKTNIAAELALVRAARADAKVSTEPPQSYFIFKRAHGFRCPAVFVICEDFDFRLERGPNMINALAKVNVSIGVEDQNRDALTVKCWRYQAALARMLDNTELTNADGSVRLVTKEVRHSFDGIYCDRDMDPEDPRQVFFMEVVIELEVEHYEKKV